MDPKTIAAARKFDRENARDKAAATHDLRQAVRDYISECDNPVPDYAHRRILRNRLRELADCPREPAR